MCGIAGIYSFAAGAPPVDSVQLRTIRDHMAARGPDGKGEWVSADSRVGLAHRRLSIIDLSENAGQPMTSADGRLVITFNGEIYNWRELRRELEAQGHVFRTSSDTEVLLHLYARHGEGMLAKLRGMFAFAVWDARERTLFLARDAFGIKPLYYACDGTTLRFASQVKALLAGGGVDTTPQPAGQVGFFLWGSVPAPFTLYRGIHALPAGHFMRVSPSGATAAKPYCLLRDLLAEASDNPARGSRADALDAIAAALRDSVRAHHVSDVPVALFLSSGIDSALLAALSGEGHQHPRALTLAFEEYLNTPDDEAPLARELAAMLGAQHECAAVGRRQFEAQRGELFAAMDQPTIDGINAWFVSRAAQLAGIKVALSGVGGDELFASYPSFSQLPKITAMTRPFGALPGLGTALRKAMSIPRDSLYSPKYAGLFEYGGTLGGAYLLRRALFMPWEHSQWLDDSAWRQGWDALQTLPALADTTRGISSQRLAISSLEMGWYMRHQLLADTDWASMAHSLEVRVPFLDLPLLKTAAPWLAAHPGITKREVAAHAAPNLPPRLLNRPKTGFAVPVRSWLMGRDDQQLSRGLRDWAAIVYQESAPANSPHLAHHASGSVTAALWSPEMATPGGIQNYMWRLWEVLTTAGSVRQPPSGLSLMDAPDALRGFEHPSRARPLGADKGKLRFLARALLKRQPGATAIVGHLHHAPIAWCARKTGAISRYVVVLHGIEAWKRVPMHQRIALRAADAVVATTQFTATTCATVNKLPLRNFQVIPLCADPAPSAPDPRFALDGEFRILFVARLAVGDKYKGLDTLIAAVQRIREQGVPATLHVIGDGDDRPRLEALSSAPGLREHVRFHGRVSDARLQSAYASAHVFAMPSAKEGFGIVFLEAMRRAVPCIGGSHGGTPEVFRDSEEGTLVSYGDVDALAQKLAWFASDEGTRRRLGEAGRMRFERDYTFASFSARWQRLLGTPARS